MADKKASQRKASALKRSAARSAGRTRATLATPGKVVESGMGGYAVAKAAQAAMKTVAKKSPKPKPTTSKPKATTNKETTKPKRNRVVCANCGRGNLVPAGRVFKTCTKCGYTLGRLPK